MRLIFKISFYSLISVFFYLPNFLVFIIKICYFLCLPDETYFREQRVAGINDQARAEGNYQDACLEDSISENSCNANLLTGNERNKALYSWHHQVPNLLDLFIFFKLLLTQLFSNWFQESNNQNYL